MLLILCFLSIVKRNFLSLWQCDKTSMGLLDKRSLKICLYHFFWKWLWHIFGSIRLL
jgi:hypothetical protein